MIKTGQRHRHHRGCVALGKHHLTRDDNAAVLAARIVDRLAASGPVRITPVMARFLEAAADALGDDAGTVLRRLASGRLDGRAADQALDAICDPTYARALRALIRDTLSPDVIHAGVKYNVIPGDAVIEVDCRVLPGMDELGNLLWIADHVESGQYDVIVVDAAPTGETLRLLSLPEASRWWIERIAPIGRRVSRIGRPMLERMIGVPMPRAAPVMIATLSFSFMMIAPPRLGKAHSEPRCVRGVPILLYRTQIDASHGLRLPRRLSPPLSEWCFRRPRPGSSP